MTRCTLLLLSTVTWTCLAQPANLLRNGSADSTKHWTPRAGGVFSHDGGAGGAAAGSLSITKPRHDPRPHCWIQAIDAPAKRPCKLELKVAMRAKGLGPGSSVNVMIQLLGADGRMLGGARCTALSRDAAWRVSETVFLVPKACTKLRVLAYLVGKGQTWFDDFRLIQTDRAVTRPAAPARAASADAKLRELARGAASEIPWLFDGEQALARAKTQGKPILLYVRCTDHTDGYASARESIAAPRLRWSDDGFSKDVLFRCGPLSDPDVSAVIQRRFVPCCLTYILGSHGRGMPDRKLGPDPLAGLGLKASQLVTPALLVLSSEGKLTHKLHRMGILSTPLIDRWLRAALAGSKAPANADARALMRDGWLGEAAKRLDPAALEQRASIQLREGQLGAVARTLRGRDGAAAARLRGLALLRAGRWEPAAAELARAGQADGAPFYLGWCLARLGQHEAARKAWRAIAGPTPFGRRAAACLLEHGWRPMMAVVMRDQTLPAGLDQTEHGEPRPLDVDRSLTALLELQRHDGSWGGHRGPVGLGFSDAAITAIAADALLDWQARAGQALRPRMAAANARAAKWLATWSGGRSRGGSDSFNHAYALMHMVRTGDQASAKRVIARIASSQNADGNWSVYHPGRPASFNTALCLLALSRASKAGLAVPKARLARGVKALAAMRQPSGHFPYSTMKGHEWMTSDWAAIARNPLCELALLENGEDTRKQLTRALGFFVKHHAELRAPTKMFYDYFNQRGHGGYYFCFAHHNAMLASSHAPVETRAKLRQAIRSAVTSAMELDGTFVDSTSIGRAYGTAMALRILAVAP